MRPDEVPKANFRHGMFSNVRLSIGTATRRSIIWSSPEGCRPSQYDTQNIKVLQTAKLNNTEYICKDASSVKLEGDGVDKVDQNNALRNWPLIVLFPFQSECS
jgi:hypothetical protein